MLVIYDYLLSPIGLLMEVVTGFNSGTSPKPKCRSLIPKIYMYEELRGNVK